MKKFNSIQFDSRVSDIPPDTLIGLYKMMLRIRKVQLKIEEEYYKDEMKTPVHLCIGQEAIPAGVCANLKKEDYVFSNHRGHGHYISKGGNLKNMMAELYCKQTGCSRGRGGSMHLIDTSVGLLGSSSIVSGGIPIAVGSAMASRMRNLKHVSVVFFGDAASEEGVLYESMNFASLKRLPVVFVCENNFYSVFSHISSRQVNDDISARSAVFDIPSCKIDGTNILDVYLKSKKAVRYARSGRGPFFLECRVYRWRGHAGAGDDLMPEYRKPLEHKRWMKKDAVKDFEKRLIREKVFRREELRQIDRDVDKEIGEAFDFARKSALPDKRELKKYLYG